MSPRLVPSTLQIEALLGSLLEKEPEARVLGVRASKARQWPEFITGKGRSFRLVWCGSGLELREQLDTIADDPDIRTVLVTPLDETMIGCDVLARLPSGRLVQADRWDSLRAAFGVRGVDPRLRGQEWLADLLLDRAPVGGYSPAPGGVLDLDTAWRSVMEQSLGLHDARADATTLLWWTLGEGNVERFAALPETARARIGERLAQEGGSAAEIVVAAIAAGRGVNALALGLACTVVFAAGATEDALRDAAVRIEPIIGGRRVTPEAGAALADAARRVAGRLEPMGPVARDQHCRAAALLAELGATQYAGRSPALVAGLEARLQVAAETLVQAAASGSSIDLSRAATLVRLATSHDRAGDQSQRVERLAMAARLCRWLMTSRRPSADFVSAARAYAEDGGFADRARQALRAGDPIPNVAAAYGQLREMALAGREEENRGFGSLLKDWNAAGSGGDGVLPIERVLDAVVSPLAAETPVLLLVLDGLSFAVHRALVGEFVRQGWIELTPRGSAVMPPVIAALPTVTEVSRASLLSGTLTRGTASFERAGFAAHARLRQASRAGKPPLLFHKADVGAGPELEEAVRHAITDQGQQVVGVVHNAVDAQLGGSDQLELVWSAESLRQVAALLRLARDAGRVVVVTGDHGHVLEDGTTQLAAAGGDRWRGVGAVRDGEVDMRGGRVCAEAGGHAVVMAWSERIRYGAKRNGYHGGASPQEVVVPIAVLSAREAPRERGHPIHGALRDWVEAPPAEPSWWHADESPLAAVSIAVPQTQSESRRRDARQPDLFRAAQLDPTRSAWVNRLFTSSTYEAQRRLAGRGAPSDDSLRAVLLALDARGGRLSQASLAQALGVPPLRAGSIVSAARRILNVDQAQVLSLDAAGDEIVLNARLLRVQFELGEP